jgi:uncharacterized protein
MAKAHRLVYLHGFRSSPESFKARWLRDRMEQLGLADQWHCPRLPMSPSAAIEMLRESLDLQPHDVVIGSSLGGFYATYLAETTGCSAIVLNPVVHAARDLSTQVGEHRPYHDPDGSPEAFRPEYVDELRRFELACISHPQRYFLIAATGDEVLDYREMVRFYSGARQWVIAGSDHGLSDFAQYGDEVLVHARFL